MKNTNKVFVIIAFVAVIGLLMAGCGSSPQTTASVADELDAAIREASDYLNTRIPNGNKVAFINISGGYPDLADYILSDLSKHGVNDGIFSVVDRALLDQVREELNFNMSGEVSDQSAQAIGQMLGAQTIVSGSVRKIGTLYRLDVKAIEVQTAGVQGQWNRNIPDGATIAALTVTSGSGTATATTSGGRTQTVTTGGQAEAAPAPVVTAPRAGTYLFWPRPQATKNGIPVDAYIYKIVVRGRNMLIYVGNEPRGPNTGYYSSAIFSFGFYDVLMTNLDRPSQTWSKVEDSPRTGNADEGGVINSFENITTMRFKLESGLNLNSGSTIFEEIDLSKAEFEP